MPISAAPLFEPFTCGPLTLRNRIVMAPMTRFMSSGGVPGPDVAEYYARRASGEVGLIVTEGTWIDHPGAPNSNEVPCFHGEDALAGWKAVVEAVHAEGGKIMPQLWHVGLFMTDPEGFDGVGEFVLRPEQVGPSGMAGSMLRMPEQICPPMTESQAQDVVDSFARGAADAMRLGFDGVALHGGHGYLFDQFFWHVTNLREDRFGGSDLGQRARFAVEVVKAIRSVTTPDFPIMLRYSQWKLYDYGARLAETPQELERLLSPLAEAGVDIFDASTRRFWEPAFDNDGQSLAAWTRKLSGKPTMAVGSVGLDKEIFSTWEIGQVGQPASLDGLLEALERGDFDLVGVGRALLSDPQWPIKVRAGALESANPYSRNVLETLY